MVWKRATDLPAGTIFGNWIVRNRAGFDESMRNRTFWCECSCGTIQEVRGTSLTTGRSTRCKTPGKHPTGTRPVLNLPLTDRQVEILRWVEKGCTSLDISKSLFITPGVVDDHLRRISARLGTHTRLEAVKVAQERGFL